MLDVLLVAVNATVSAVFIVGALGKLVHPLQLTQALSEIFPSLTPVLTKSAVRTLALGEALAATGLAWDPVRLSAAVLVACFGMSFILAGVAGRLRHSSVACGCLGLQSDKSLGARNAIYGVAAVVCAALNFLILPQGFSNVEIAAWTTSLGALLILGLTFVLNTGIIRAYSRALPTSNAA